MLGERLPSARAPESHLEDETSTTPPGQQDTLPAGTVIMNERNRGHMVAILKGEITEIGNHILPTLVLLWLCRCTPVIALQSARTNVQSII